MAFTNAVMSLFPMPPKAQSTPVQATSRSDGAGTSGPTAIEKQAMIDDLQLEITKRARGLRSIYNEQARQLRESLERRVHRIPPRMRSKTMGELADEQAKKALKPTAPPKTTAPARSAKRTSDVVFGVEDKENAPTAYTDLQPQKKRAKAAEPRPKTALQKSTTTSPVKSVLSPRSHNSRTLPSKIASPEKSSRLAVPQPKTRPTSRAVSRQGATAAKKTATRKVSAEEESEGRDSEGSTTSARTTIVKRAEPAKRTATKKAVPKATTTSTTRKRAPAAKAEPAVPAATRTLRKRGLT